jgi:predicted DNA-binding protein (MmcQ/YjbR family)
MAKKKSLPTDKVLQELRAFGLAYPGAHTKSPWPGHLDLAVNDKTFAYLSIEGEPFGISCKLPRSSEVALMLPFCTPTPYGLGKSGWVSAKFPEGKALPTEMLKEWIDESYRAQAPKKFVKQLDAGGGAAAAIDAAATTVKKRKAVAKRTGAGKTSKRATKKRVS